MNHLSEYDRLWAILQNEKTALADRILAGDSARYLYLKNQEPQLAADVAAATIPLAHTYLSNSVEPDLEIYDALERAYIARGPYDFHSYLVGLEWRRPAKERFYQPRMSVLRPVVDDLTDMMVNDKYDIIEISMPPRVGKSSLGLFFISWCIGRNPDSPILATGYAEKITKMFYAGVAEIYDDPVTYNYREIFPQIQLVDSSAKDLTLDFRDDGGQTARKYKSLTCRPIDGSLTGATEARQLLYCDDLVRDIEEALSRDRLDALDEKLVTNAQSRKKEGCKELHIGTHWSVHDPMSRLAKRHEDNPRCKVIVLPALDPETDESNFDYPYGVGFSTAYYKALRDVYEEKDDLVTWECVYQQNPIEREGLLFPADELTYVIDLPPLDDNRPDDAFAFCDVAFGGNDFLCMPIAYQWGDDPPLIIDVVFLKGDYTITEPLVAGTLIQRKVARVIFEANNGGDFYSQDVLEILKEKDYKMFLTSKRADSTKSKETRIIQHSPAVKSFTFLHPKSEHASPMYRQFLNQLTTYTVNGKNKNDDAPDALAGLATMQRTNLNATVKIFDRSRI